MRGPQARLVAVGTGGNIETRPSQAGALVEGLYAEPTRESALVELSKLRESLPGLAVALWHSSGMDVLKEEIQGIYPQLSQPPTITPASSQRACNAIALLQCLAVDEQTRPLFLQAQYHLLVYPFLHALGAERPLMYLRLTALGVIGALLRSHDPQSVRLLLDTDIVWLCLRIMERDETDPLSKTVATFIVQKLMLDDQGLNCICSSEDYLYTITAVLSKMIHALEQNPCARMLKHAIRCYLALTEHAKGRVRVRQCLPSSLKQLPGSIRHMLEEDRTTENWLRQLLANLQSVKVVAIATASSVDNLV